MDNIQIERITKMENALNTASFAVEVLSVALEQYTAVLPQLKELKEYYQSATWMQDYDDDNSGKFPKELCRGVLSEDAVYDLLEDNDSLKNDLIKLCEKLK